MYKQSATDITTFSPTSFDKWINSFDTVLADCDGVLWMGRRSIPGSVEAIDYLKKLGKNVFFVTNSPLHTRSELQAKAVHLGFNIDLDHIMSSGYMVAKYLSDLKFEKKVYNIGTDAMTEEFQNFGIQCVTSDKKEYDTPELFNIGLKLDEEVGAVVVGFDNQFNYAKMFEASNYLQNSNCLFLATSNDVKYPIQSSLIVPAMGPIIKSIEVASGRTATILGKPTPNIFHILQKTNQIIIERTLMIGDTAEQDILFGFNCGFQTLLVGTGISSLNDVQKWRNSEHDDDKKLIPDFYLPKLGDLMSLINKN